MELKSVNKIETNKTELEIAIDGETFKKTVNKVYKRQVGKINIPGFRKGKAPKSVIEKMYGKKFFYEDAMKELYPDAFDEAVKQAGLNVIPEILDIEVVSASETDGFVFKVKVSTYPEINIDGYIGLEIEVPAVEVTDEKIDERIELKRKQMAITESVTDRPVENGDTVTIDFEGFMDGKAFEGGKGEMYKLNIGSGNFIPGFEEKLIGHNVDEEFDIDVTFPEEYQVDELAGKPAVFKIKIHDIETKVIPELDDEFVKDVSVDSETVEDYRKEVAKDLEEELNDRRDKEIEDKLANAVIEKVEGEIPQAMYENRITDMYRQQAMDFRSQDLSMEDYMMYTGANEEMIREQLAPLAEKQVKLRLALEKIAEIEKLEASEEDVEKEYEKLAEQYSLELDKVKELVSKDDLFKDVLVSKAMDTIKATAVIK